MSSRGDLEDKFQIDPQTGKITLISPLTESDVGKEINLAVQASDNGKMIHDGTQLMAHSCCSEEELALPICMVSYP